MPSSSQESASARLETVIAVAAWHGEGLVEAIAADREPRRDVLELQSALGPDRTRMLDYGDVDRSRRPDVRAIRRTLGPAPALARLAFLERGPANAFFTNGEDVGLPLAALLGARRVQASHTMIAHTLAPRKKRALLRLGVQRRLDRVICYASTEERLLLEDLHLPAGTVERMNFQADDRFFRPLPVAEEPDLICAAGQLLRDYDTLVEAATDLPVRLRIAAGSPWSPREPRRRGGLPPNVDWRRYDRFALRDLYSRSAVAVVPLVENDYQSGIATILEMMAMGRCVVASRTSGQTDTIVDGVNGVYVPPGDPGRSARRLPAARRPRGARTDRARGARVRGARGRARRLRRPPRARRARGPRRPLRPRRV